MFKKKTRENVFVRRGKEKDGERSEERVQRQFCSGVPSAGGSGLDRAGAGG